MTHCLSRAFLALVLACTCGPVSADVVYVSEWRTDAPPGQAEFGYFEFRGVVALETPTLREVGRWTDLPAAENVETSADGRWLFLWNSSDLPPPAADRRLHVVERRTMRVVATWAAPVSAPGDCAGPVWAMPYNVQSHPSRPRVLIIEGACWFDTESGTWVATPQSLGLPADWHPWELDYPRLSDDGQRMTFWRPSPAPSLHVILNLDAGQFTWRSPSNSPGSVIAFGGSVLAFRTSIGPPDYGYRLVDIASNATLRDFTLPVFALDYVADPRLGLLVASGSGAGRAIHRVANITADPVRLNATSLPTDGFSRMLPTSDGVLLAGSTGGCGIGGCVVFEHYLDFIDDDGALRASLRATTSTVGGQLLFTSYTANGDAVAGGLPSPVVVPTLDVPAAALLAFALALLGAATLATEWRRPQAKGREVVERTRTRDSFTIRQPAGERSR